MATPKDITGSLTRWQGNSAPEAPKAPTAASAPSLRRLKTDTVGGIIYTLVIGAIASQVIFLLSFDLF